MPLPLCSPEDKHFSLQLIQSAGEGRKEQSGTSQYKEPWNIPWGILENTGIAYVRARLTQMLIQQRPVM